MHFQESETVELTAIFIDDIKKEIISFANCNGGSTAIKANRSSAKDKIYTFK